MTGLYDHRCLFPPKRFYENNQQNKNIKLKALISSSHMSNLLYNQFYSAGSLAQQCPAFSDSLEPLHSGTKFPVKLFLGTRKTGQKETEGCMRTFCRFEEIQKGGEM